MGLPPKSVGWDNMYYYYKATLWLNLIHIIVLEFFKEPCKNQIYIKLITYTLLN